VTKSTVSLGSIPSSLLQLAKLNELELNHNQLTGLVPKFDFSQLAANQECDLSDNKFACPLPPGSSECRAACVQ
jgi:Leucine-rich repeat (LRR) protein